MKARNMNPSRIRKAPLASPARYLLLTLLGAWSLGASATVDLKSGNYAATWLDLAAANRVTQLQIQRHYNSRTRYSGLFGPCWCSNLETRIEVLPEGRIRLVECGAGEETLHAPAGFSPGQLEAVVDRIVARHQAAHPAQPTAVLRTQLLRHADQRLAWARHVGLEMPEIPQGVVFAAERLAVETIAFDGQHYIRSRPDGSLQHFDGSGRLVLLTDRSDNWIRFDREDGRLSAVVNRAGERLALVYEPGTPRVQLVIGPDRQLARYYYEDGKLTSVTNAWGSTYHHAYDASARLIRTEYPDGTFIAIDHDPDQGTVSRFTHRAIGSLICSEAYGYEAAPAGTPAHAYRATVTQTCSDGTAQETRFAFSFSRREDGRPVLQRVVREASRSLNPGGQPQEQPDQQPDDASDRADPGEQDEHTPLAIEYDILYHPVSGKPERIIRASGDDLSYRYRPDGLLQAKIRPHRSIVFDHDPDSHLVTRMRTEWIDGRDRVTRRDELRYAYNAQGQLIRASEAEGRVVHLKYDEMGRIREMTTERGQRLQIAYGADHGRPELLTLIGAGRVRVGYGPDGELQSARVEHGDATVLVRIATLFDTLTAITAVLNEELKY